MSTSAEQISLEDLFRRALDAASKAVNLPSIEDDTQAIVASVLRDLQAVAFRINILGLFSSNETFEEISTRNVPYMLVQYVVGETQLRVKSTESEDRMNIVHAAKYAFKFFQRLLDDYAVISEDDKRVHSTKLPTDTWKRRDAQVAQYKAKKALRTNVDNLRSRRKRPSTSSSSPTDFDLISDLLPNPNAMDDEDEEDVRELLRAVLKLFWAQALDHLTSIEREEEMLRSAPSKKDIPRGSEPVKEEGDDTWRVDMPLDKSRLIDDKGRPLQPFIILPSSAGEKARLKSEVFRPDHRLPTMTIDELLEIERQQGKFISGGGEASYNAPTSKELLQEASEMDGTIGGEEKSEQKRREEEEWAQYTEANPKGMGNTLNRG